MGASVVSLNSLKTLSLFLFITISISQNSFSFTFKYKQSIFSSGPGGSGGGIGVLCQYPHSDNLTLLDLYEAKNVYKFGNPLSYGTISQTLEHWNREWDEANSSVYEPEFNDIENLVSGIFHSVPSLPLHHDFTEWQALPDNCTYVQIAKFIDPPKGTKIEDLWTRSKLEIVLSLYNKLDDINKAALLQHEFTYFGARFSSASQFLPWGSDDVRVVVAAMSTGKSSQITYKIPNFSCSFGTGAEGNFIHHFYAKEIVLNRIKGVELTFQWLNNFIFLFKASKFIPGLTLNILKTGDLINPIELEVSYDLQIPTVNFHKFKIRLEKSGDPLFPLRIVPLNFQTDSITNGSCG